MNYREFPFVEKFTLQDVLNHKTTIEENILNTELSDIADFIKIKQSYVKEIQQSETIGIYGLFLMSEKEEQHINDMELKILWINSQNQLRDKPRHKVQINFPVDHESGLTTNDIYYLYYSSRCVAFPNRLNGLFIKKADLQNLIETYGVQWLKYKFDESK